MSTALYMADAALRSARVAASRGNPAQAQTDATRGLNYLTPELARPDPTAQARQLHADLLLVLQDAARLQTDPTLRAKVVADTRASDQAHYRSVTAETANATAKLASEKAWLERSDKWGSGIASLMGEAGDASDVIERKARAVGESAKWPAVAAVGVAFLVAVLFVGVKLA